MKLSINKKALLRGAKTAAVVGAGAMTARVGGSLARRYIGAARDFASGGALQGAVVDLGAGLALSAPLVPIVAKAARTPPAMAAGALAAGVMLGAFGGLIADRIAGGVDALMPGGAQWMGLGMPAGGYAGQLMSGALPGGVYAGPTMSGALPAPGGAYMQPGLAGFGQTAGVLF